ncbi:MAG: phosphoadenylyl-sulfate reductase [Candidatus Methylomirabilales bacterium]
MQTTSRLDKIEVDALASQLEGKTPELVVRWALERFHPRIALATSLQAEDMVIMDMAWKINPAVRVFTLDTGRLHEETYQVMERIRDRYNVAVESYFPDREAVETLEREKGFYSFRRSVEERKFCCGIRKVEPLGRALKGLEAWMTGLRREQAVTRGTIAKVELDDSHGGILKVNPLVDWTLNQVWDYIRAHDVPYNALHDLGYPSIGCAPCTRAIKPGEDIRAGRWWWERPDSKECGLHVTPVESG